MITAPIEMTRDEYHADAHGPSLSASIASVLCNQTPLHAWTQHPKLNPDYKPREDEKFDIGTAAHAILLEGYDAVHVVEASDWRTNAAKAARDEARAIGRVPLLAHVYADVLAMVTAAKKQLETLDLEPSRPFTDGEAEKTLLWHEPDGTMCRARPDWLRGDLAVIEDYKTTANANPEVWSRRMFDLGYDLRAAFYLRGLERLTGVQAEYRFIVQEKEPPFALSVIAPGPDVLVIGRKKVEYALRVWGRCLRTNDWPGYPSRVCWVELPPFEEARWLAKEEREAA